MATVGLFAQWNSLPPSKSRTVARIRKVPWTDGTGAGLIWVELSLEKATSFPSRGNNDA